MPGSSIGGYVGKLLRVDLTSERFTEWSLDEKTLRKFIGGSGLAAKILYEEIPPGVDWADPENRFILASGPLNGTIGGTGTVAGVTKGPMTNGAACVLASGFFGAYIKLAGFDAVVIQGAAKQPVYLYLHDNIAELRDARRLMGKDTWETEDLIAKELGKRESEISVFSIGCAGEHLVRFAAIVGDHGHVMGHGGVGAVWGSKNLKAVVAERGKRNFKIENAKLLRELAKSNFECTKALPVPMVDEGPSYGLRTTEPEGWLAVKNYLEKSYPSEDMRIAFGSYRKRFNRKRQPCWACRFNHCSMIEVTEGPFAGYVAEEPEFEGFVDWGPLIHQTDPGAAVVINDEVDRYGMDCNEAAWLIAWLMECYEKGLITKRDTDGLEMKWGNVEATRGMLRKMACREGFGNVLAEGAMRAATEIGGEAASMAIYTLKGNTPRAHDHRVFWCHLLDTCVSDRGRDEHSLIVGNPETLGLPSSVDPFSAEGAATMLAAGSGALTLRDCLVMCKFTLLGTPPERISELLNAVTGWDVTQGEAREVGLRIVHLLRAFNARHGHTSDMDMPSPRFGSAPPSGPGKGKAIIEVFDQAKRKYYSLMGWDSETGIPLPETLKRAGLDDLLSVREEL
jgi:aldehyde:ferredoxin oxidoreductase